MGSHVGPTLTKLWLRWLNAGWVWRLLGLSAALISLHLEIYGSSPATTSLILHRLAQRLRLTTLFHSLNKGHDMTNFFFVGGADVMDHPHTTVNRSKMLAKKRSMTLDDKDHLPRQPPPSGAPLISPHPLSTTQRPEAVDCSSATNTFATPSSYNMHSHNRSLTHSDIVTQGKRLSLQFPIQPAAGSASSPRMSPRSRPQSWVSTPLSPEMIPSPTESNFLAVIAAQERRVLELKEELVKAEEDLKMLKKHWVSQEAVRKRNDMRKVTQLQPLNTPLANLPHNDDDGDGSALWMQREMERRKALLASTKTSQRKVFSGSRHMRTLSLLSPDKAQAPSFPQPSDTRDLKDDEPRRSSLSRASTSSSGFSSPIPNKTNDDRYDLGGLPSIQRDAIIRTGKQLATDFKDGLFTFIEDIRQATVGDEALQGADANSFQNGPKLQPASSDRRPTLDRAAGSSKQGANDQSDDIGSSFWKEHGLSEPQPAAAKKIAKSARNTTPPKTPQKSTPQLAQKVVDDFDEEWDNWDTPAPPAHSTSTDGSDYSDDAGDTATTVSGRSSARTSTRYEPKKHDRHDSKEPLLTTSSSAGPGPSSDRTSQDSKRNSIPWPDLIKLSPTNLKRTASHLMKEWEKNLTPPPESRQFNLASADYIGRAEDSLN